MQVRSEVVGQTERHEFKDILKKTLTTLGKEELADNKKRHHLKILSLGYYKPYHIMFDIIDIFVLYLFLQIIFTIYSFQAMF